MSDAVSAEAVLFEGAVACDLVTRMVFRPGEPRAGSAESAERLLRDLALLEDRRGEVDDVAHPQDPALRRLEAKLDLTLQLLVRALPGLEAWPSVPVRLSARGARFDTPMPIDAATGALEWQPDDGLPLVAVLPVRRLATDGGRSWWAFDVLPMALEELVERHVFRLHRRALAAQRRG